MSAARAAARNKPVIVVKAGRSRAGPGGRGLAHRRAGRLRRRSSTPPSAAPACCAWTRCRSCSSPPRRWRAFATQRAASALDRACTNGGGAGVMAADAAALAGVPLARAGRRARCARLDAVLPANWSHANPVDIIGDAPVERYVQTLQTLLADRASGTPCCSCTRRPRSCPAPTSRARCCRWRSRTPARVLSCWLGDAGGGRGAPAPSTTPALPTFDTPEEAVRAFSLLRHLPPQPGSCCETPPAAAPARAARPGRVRAIDRRGAGRRPRAARPSPRPRRVLAAYGIPVVAHARGRRRRRRPRRARPTRIGYPVALKILSPRHQRTRATSAACALDLRRRRGCATPRRRCWSACAALRPEARDRRLHGAGHGAPAARARADRRRQHRPACSAR